MSIELSYTEDRYARRIFSMDEKKNVKQGLFTKKKKKHAEQEVSTYEEQHTIKEVEQGLGDREIVYVRERPRKPPSLFKDVLNLLAKVLAIAVIIMLLFTFMFGVLQVDDMSMSPAMKDGDLVFFYRLDRNFVATDTVVVRYDGRTQVRRVVAIAGDEVDITPDGLTVNGMLQSEPYVFEETTQFEEGITFPIVVPPGEIFIMGDGRTQSIDSRIYGSVPASDTLGSVMTIVRRRNL